MPGDDRQLPGQAYRAVCCWRPCREIGWRRLKEIAPDSFRYESTINGGFASHGRTDRRARLTLRSSIITEGIHYATYAYPPRRTFGGRTARAWHQCGGAFAADRRAGEPDHRHHPWPARYYRRYGVASWTLVWHQSAILDEFAAAL